MPRISASGRVTAGKAGEAASVDGVLINDIIGRDRALGEWQFLSDSILIGQVCENFNQPNERCYLRTTAEPQELGIGANYLAGGGGRWAAQIGGVGVYSNFGVSSGIAGVPANAGSPDGDIAIIMNYSQGFGLQVFRPSGAVVQLNVSIGSPFVYVRDGLLTFVEGGRGWRVVNLDTQSDVPFVARPDTNLLCACRAGGRIVLLDRAQDGGTRIRRADSAEGQIIVPGPSEHVFGPAIAGLPGGVIRAAWADGESERVGFIRGADVLVSSLPGPNDPAPSSIVVPGLPAGTHALAPGQTLSLPVAFIAGISVALLLTKE